MFTKSGYDALIPDAEFKTLLGDMIHQGSQRIVFNVVNDPDVVVKKIRRLQFVRPNVTEWLIWDAVKGTKLATVFGCCVSISPTGTYLMMERLGDVDDGTTLPAIPLWVRDAWHSNNFGQSSAGEVKLRDYGSIDLCKGLRCGE